VELVPGRFFYGSGTSENDMERLDELDRTEIEDLARCLDANYTPEKFQADYRKFVKLKTYILMRREREKRRRQRQ
jgi:hypothetical protein